VFVYSFIHISNTDVFLVLNPNEKIGYFTKHWSVDLQEEDVVKYAEVAWVSSHESDLGQN